MLTAKNLTVKKKSRYILQDINICFEKASIGTLLGKSGSGKSTLLRTLSGLETGYEGTIFYEDEDIRNMKAEKRATKLGFIMQSYALFPHMTVLQMCMMPLQVVLKMQASVAKKRALDILSSFDMQDFALRYPKTLSGGQRQRVAIAQACALQPSMLLLDEPTSALDSQNAQILAKLLRELKNRGTGIIVATHDEQFARQISDSFYYF